jgi:prepilin peptidase CpaA
LWLKLFPLVQMLVVMAVAGGLLTLFMLVRHRWLKAEGRPEIPYGVAIVAAGFWVVANDVLTISGS